MIIWINGAFGSGKTSCAFELQNRLSQAFIYDPEQMGSFLDKHYPENLRKNDFQDYPLWRQITVATLKELARTFEGTIIVPMTITNKQYYDDIIGQLVQENISINHFILSANKETLIRRLNKRFEFGNSWGKQHIDTCIKAFEQDIPGQQIRSDLMPIETVVERIASLSDLEINPDKRTQLRKYFDRLMISIRRL